MKTWKILSSSKETDLNDLQKLLFLNRGLKTKKEQKNFLHPAAPVLLTAKDVEINEKELTKAIKRIVKAITNQEQIVVYGDYDCDGICATAIMWETLHALGAKVLPFIPDRAEEGYGLSLSGLNNLKEKLPETKLVITVDHGIVAVEQTKYAQEKLGWDVIITDHHTVGKKIPQAFAIVHTIQLSGSGVSWFLAREIINNYSSSEARSLKKSSRPSVSNNNLDLAALGTIADLVPLQGANRSIAKYGLEEIHHTKRVGILALIREAGLVKDNIETYEVSYILAPRLNALGRIDNALDALRLLCTNDAVKAGRLAKRLNEVNGERQRLTEEISAHAKQITDNKKQITNLIFVAHESYNQGVIGLVAGRLVEQYYRPAIVVAKSEKISKGSARSIAGFNIVEAIRIFSDLLIDVGGHPMAAGFTVETGKLEELEKGLNKFADENITQEQLTKQLKIDAEIPADMINTELWEQISSLKPFGMANPEPIFVSEVEVVETRLVGNTSKHLKLTVKAVSDKDTSDGVRMHSSEVEELKKPFSAIAFNFADMAKKINPGDKIQIAYCVSKNIWNGREELQLKIKDIKID